MSFNKKFLSKSPLAYHGGPHDSQPDVKANTKAFSTMSDILPNKNITPPQQSNYGLGASTNANWDKPKKPSDEERAKSLAMQKKMLEIRQSKAGTKVLNDVQDKLETAGMTPGVGIVPDAINTGISAARGLSAKFSGDKKGQLEAAKNMGIHSASMLPIGGIFAAGGNKLRKYTNFMTRTGRAESKLLKNPNYTRVYTADGSSKIMDKKFTTKLYRTEDANISNKLYDKPGVEYNTYNWAGDNAFSQGFYNKKTKSALNPDVKLKPEENRRFFEMYFDKQDAKMFSLDSKNAPNLASKMSKAPGEYVIPPSIMKDIRKRGSGYGFQVSKGNKNEIIERLFGKDGLSYGLAEGKKLFSTSSKDKAKNLFFPKI
jgi:hypothetical protein